MRDLKQTINVADVNTTVTELSLSPIQQFYTGTNVLITGATGFLGKVLVEKLLRSCPTISTIYLIVRNKKGKNLHSRIDELFDDVLFDRLRKEFPKFRHKIVGVAGDCCLPDVGLTLQDRQMLIEKISVVFHVAATVRFDEKLKMAVRINIRAPQELMQMAQLMPNLKTFMHVSTAYCNCPQSVIEEKVYSSPTDSKKLILLTENIPEKLLESITPSILDKWPNTYTYTKALAEDIVRQDGFGLPVGIFRPAIVISTYKEPIAAWINNMYGPTGICAASGNGLLRVLHCDESVNGNVVPVDMCVNSLIAASWEIGTNYEKNKAKEEFPKDPPVYHFESSNDQPITWGEFMRLNEKYGLFYPSTKAIWYYCLYLQKSRLSYLFFIFFLHYLPALIVDGALLCIGKSPMLMKVYRKIHRFSDVLRYFSTKNFEYRSSKVQSMIQRMSQTDKDLFFCDLKQLDWEEFFSVYIRGVRVYLVQDSMDTLNEALTKWRRLYWLHQGTKILLSFLALRILWSLVLFVHNSIFL